MKNRDALRLDWIGGLRGDPAAVVLGVVLIVLALALYWPARVIAWVVGL